MQRPKIKCFLFCNSIDLHYLCNGNTVLIILYTYNDTKL